jgi:hypothetical protein
MIHTREEIINRAKLFGDYYRDLSLNYTEYSNDNDWPKHPRDPFKRTRAESQIRRRKMEINKKYLELNKKDHKHTQLLNTEDQQ